MQRQKGRRSLLGMLVETISAIVTPIIPAMLACGFIKTLAVLFTVVFKVDEANSTIQVLNVVSDTLYAFSQSSSDGRLPRNLKQTWQFLW